jgi:hypothetical protein
MEANAAFGGDEKEMMINRNSSFFVLCNKVITDKKEITLIVGGVASQKIMQLRKILVSDKMG